MNKNKKTMFYHACMDAQIPEKYINFDVKNWDEKNKNFKFISKIVERFDILSKKSMCLALIGFFGTGKTFLSSFLATSVIKKKKTARFISLFKMLDHLQKDRFSSNNIALFYKKLFLDNDLVVVNGINRDVWETASNWSKVAFIELITDVVATKCETMLVFNIDTSRKVKTKKEAAKVLKSEFETRFLKLIFDNFEPYVIREYNEYSKKVSKQWNEVMGENGC